MSFLIKIFDENIQDFSPYKCTLLVTKRFKVQKTVSLQLQMTPDYE